MSFDELFAAARNGDEQTAKRIRAELDAHPAIMDFFGNPAGIAERILLAGVLGGDIVAREATLKKLKRLRRDLAGDDPSPLDRLLIEAISLAWLALTTAQMEDAAHIQAGVRVRDVLARRVAAAARRFDSACLTLAKVRRLTAGLKLTDEDREAELAEQVDSMGPESRETPETDRGPAAVAA